MDKSGLLTLVQTACVKASLPLLPPYLPGILMTFTAYHLTYLSIGPWLSTLLFPKVYVQLRGRKKLDWDENVVSLVQAIVICVLAGQVVLLSSDSDVDVMGRRWRGMRWEDRIWGYTEPDAVVLTVANGYFYWHFQMMVRHRDVFGWSMVAHAMAVSFLMTNAYRPAFMTYAPASFLYEFSTIFLDIQSTLRSLKMEGTTIQIVNGMALFVSFFLLRVVYATHLQAWFYMDLWSAFGASEQDIPVGKARIPTWLLASHAVAAVTLQLLNYWWFYKISRTVYRKFFAGGVVKRD
ncbi:uncharacterized protein Z520_03366 [Fonsecaea multimorphosa CBS 102226]|uniref:TLC domain-containing protein n=1 Tax=Fonsecaea multimorphosa CBS 102226 TaxID=1442371 RepID=A0A0D2HFI2_9EURO|nr:uncharacterized protein Z520_03366 [Fonsecaea multimorphosa CBS 102226]KIY00701.1 hypothetical protein Z520_03366 [Fonsecaea multimorphosa CBS 102226]OAL27747.1 hypothetical protein AYO22_03289 [Fonsecaea multimorphosa]